MAVTQVIIVVFIRMLLTETLSDANARYAPTIHHCVFVHGWLIARSVACIDCDGLVLAKTNQSYIVTTPFDSATVGVVVLNALVGIVLWAIYSIAAKANEAAAAGTGASTFAPKRGYKLVDSSAKREDGFDVTDDGSTDNFTQMEVGKAGKRHSEVLQSCASAARCGCSCSWQAWKCTANRAAMCKSGLVEFMQWVAESCDYASLCR